MREAWQVIKQMTRIAQIKKCYVVQSGGISGFPQGILQKKGRFQCSLVRDANSRCLTHAEKIGAEKLELHTVEPGDRSAFSVGATHTCNMWCGRNVAKNKGDFPGSELEGTQQCVGGGTDNYFIFHLKNTSPPRVLPAKLSSFFRLSMRLTAK